MKKRKVIRLVKKYYNWWQHWLGLGYWATTVQFSNKKVQPAPEFTRIAITDVDWRYLTATITFHPKQMRKLSKDDIERVVIHECMHIFLNEMREEGIDHEERCATQLQKAFRWVKYAENV